MGVLLTYRIALHTQVKKLKIALNWLNLLGLSSVSKAVLSVPAVDVTESGENRCKVLVLQKTFKRKTAALETSWDQRHRVLRDIPL